MKISVWTDMYHSRYNLTPEEVLVEFRKHGYEYCELSDEHTLALIERGNPEKVGAEFGKFAQNAGINLLQGHLFLTAEISKPEDRAEIKKQLDLYNAIGVKNAVLI